MKIIESRNKREGKFIPGVSYVFHHGKTTRFYYKNKYSKRIDSDTFVNLMNSFLASTFVNLINSFLASTFVNLMDSFLASQFDDCSEIKDKCDENY